MQGYLHRGTEDLGVSNLWPQGKTCDTPYLCSVLFVYQLQLLCLQLVFNLSKSYTLWYFPASGNCSTLEPLHFDFMHTQKLFPWSLSTLQLPLGPLEAYYTCIHLKYWDCNRRPAQCTSWSPCPEPPHIQKPWDLIYVLGSWGLTCNTLPRGPMHAAALCYVL